MLITQSLKEYPKELIKTEVKPKDYYNNVFKFADLNKAKFQEENMKIAYGYANDTRLSEDLWFRHCFILDKYNNVLDLTALQNNTANYYRYIVFKTFNSTDVLFKYKEYKKDTSLIKSLHPYEQHVIRKYLNYHMSAMITTPKQSHRMLYLQNV